MIKFRMLLSERLSMVELIGVHGIFNISKFADKPRSSLWCEIVVLTDILESSEFCFRDPPAVLGQLDNFFCILLENVTVSLTALPLFRYFQ